MSKFNKDKDETGSQKIGFCVEADTFPFLKNGVESIDLMDIIDVKAIQSMMDDFYYLTKIGVAILDLKGNVLVATGWQDICTQFHRQHPDTLKNCIESDLNLSAGIAPGSFKAYRCKNNMWDIATPIVVGGKHMGNLYLGQFFYEDETPDGEWFRSHANRHGFDETAYLAALDRVPRWRRETVQTVMRFYTRFTELMSELSYSNLKLTYELEAHKSTIASLKMSEARFAEALAWSQESEEKYRILFEQTSDALFVAQDGRIVFQNPRTFEVTGYSLEEFQSRPFASFIHEDDREMVVERHFQRLNGEKPPERYGFRIFHKNGHILWTELKAVLIQWDQKPAALCFMTDVTERKQAEDDLRMAHEKMLTILDSIDSTVYVADLDTYEILFMNKKMITDFGGDKTGGSCFKEFRNNTEICHVCTNKQLIDENGRPAGVCTWHDRNPVTGRCYINYDRAIEWIDGRVVRLQIATDITDLKTMEARLMQSQKLEAIGTLAGGIAHDFNNILFSIIGNADMLLDDFPEDSPARRKLTQIHAGGLRASALVQQILAFARQEETRPAMMKIQPIIKEALNLLRSTIPTTIAITRDIQPDCGPVKADPNQIHQILMNLATNAYHAMEENGGELKVTLKEMELNQDDLINPDMDPGLYVCLTVSDTGTGMDKDVMNKIFDPFFTTKAKGKGTGMGLSVVHGIVKRINGAILVNSEPGHGTAFHVYLPIVQNIFEPQPVNLKSPVVGGKEKILLVDDEEAIIRMEKQALTRLGYDVSSRVSSIEALEAFKANPEKFDLVITDMAMPKMTGDKLADEMINIRPDIPILLCTGFSHTLTDRKIKSLGIKCLMMKPVMIKDLALKIREVLDKDADRNQQ
jgi:PAS domain S-box-containing protein